MKFLNIKIETASRGVIRNYKIQDNTLTSSHLSSFDCKSGVIITASTRRSNFSADLEFGVDKRSARLSHYWGSVNMSKYHVNGD